jgi:hypothetical protein
MKMRNEGLTNKEGGMTGPVKKSRNLMHCEDFHTIFMLVRIMNIQPERAT